MKSAKWIWDGEGEQADSYVRFFSTFQLSTIRKVSIELSCDSNYELYVNGRLAGFGQYADYPYDKVYDSIEIASFCKEGKNRVSILVWYYGKNFSTYCKGSPGLIFEVNANGKIVDYSGEKTLCHRAEDYISGRGKIITKQMGFSYTYDTSRYDGCNGEFFEPSDYHSAVVVNQNRDNLRIRPIKKTELLPFSPATEVSGVNRLYDLGKETVGYLSLRFCAPKGETVLISWGEHLIRNEKGNCSVPRIIANRDFSVELVGCGETVDFSNYMRRLGCRYLQVECEQSINVEKIGLYPAEYPVTVLPFSAGSPLRQQIYDTAVHTLRCCMYEHYEDCPWREQALYTLDSRNQMLCGYHAFAETEFQRASLELFCKDRRDDGLLHITAPCAVDLVIPSFSLFWIIQMKEYAEHTKDISLIVEYENKMKALLSAFLNRAENNLIPNFFGSETYWNFYEWNPTLKGTIGRSQEKSFDLILNVLVSWCLRHMATVESMIGNERDAEWYLLKSKQLNVEINRSFFASKTGLYTDHPLSDEYSTLGNALAILCGAADGKTAHQICEAMAEKRQLIPTTLSMRIFEYDAMLETDIGKYAPYILSEIDETYGYMLNKGATSFWETLRGAEDFGGAGSLCHGWSAIPIIYYHRLLMGI